MEQARAALARMAADWGKSAELIWLDLQGALATVIKGPTHATFEPDVLAWLSTFAGTPFPGSSDSRVGGPTDPQDPLSSGRAFLRAGPADVWTKVSTLPPNIAPPDRELDGRRIIHALGPEGPVWIPWAEVVPYDPSLDGAPHGQGEGGDDGGGGDDALEEPVAGPSSGLPTIPYPKPPPAW